MSEEIKNEEKQCPLKSQCFRNFLTVTVGSFVGVFCAISLFAALNKPPVMIPPCPCMHNHDMINRPMPPKMQDMEKFGHKDIHKFHKEFRENPPQEEK